RVSERQITLDEVVAAHERGTLREVFGSGTGAVIAPVGELGFEGGRITIADFQVGELARKLYDAITGIQYGTAPDPYGWMVEVPHSGRGRGAWPWPILHRRTPSRTRMTERPPPLSTTRARRGSSALRSIVSSISLKCARSCGPRGTMCRVVAPRWARAVIW